MVKPVTEIVKSISMTKRPLVLELVGPAGAGKSALLQALSQRDATIRAGLRIPKHSYIKDAFLLLPTFLALHTPYNGLHWKEMKRILYLETLSQILQQEASKNNRAIILDEGPIYMLSRLRVFADEGIYNDSFKQWWQSTINQWADSVDVIVCLDAEDPILARRIRTRNQPYPVKDTTDRSLREFFARYRAAFKQVISEMTTHKGPKIITFVTDQESTKQIADKILTALFGECNTCRPLV